jgi:phospholipid/cholesterol/gamma-HCH transport system ATP-binding protein
MIELIDIHKKFEDTVVLDGVNCCFEKNKVNIVLGKSGMGKSVLTKIIVGLIRQDSGKIVFDGEDISNFNEDQLMKIRRKCCYNFQLPALLKSKTVFENVAIPLVWKGRKHSGVAEKVNLVLKEVGLFSDRGKFPAELSYGMQKRVSFARSLIMDPDYIVFDEPTSGLDPITSLKLYDLVKMFVEKHGKGAILITHDIDGVEYLGGDVKLLMDGEFVFQGTHNEFRAMKDENIRAFMSGDE